jgi:protein-tyrosine phosphatase
MDYSFITDRLATGARINSTADVASLTAAGITAIVNCQDEFDDGQFLTGTNLAYLWNGTPDDGAAKSTEWFSRCISFAIALLSQPNHKIYVHCAGGQHRGPSAAYAILRALGSSATEAERLIHTGRPSAVLRYARDAEEAIKAMGYI